MHAMLKHASLLVAALMTPAIATAQTDYFNTDAGRPIRVEDAYAIERRAFELQVAPLRLERTRGGAYRWGVEPELAIGLLPRMQVEFGFPIVHTEGGRARSTALGGVEMSALYNLNVETRLPALAVVADVVLPVGSAGPAEAVPSLKAIATKTWPLLRVHVNAQRTFADEAAGVRPGAPGRQPAHAEFSRWMTGLAIDKTMPLRAMLLTGEVVVSAPMERDEPRRVDVAGGTRYQLSPRIAFDAGGGYRLRGEDPGWFLTTGAAVAVGFPWMPRR